MSLDVQLADKHAAHAHLCRKEMDVQIMHAVKEIGVEGLLGLERGDSKGRDELTRHLLRKSASAAGLLTSDSWPGLTKAHEAATQSSSSSLQAAADKMLRRQQKVRDAVEQQVARETQALRSQIAEEASERRQLHARLKQLRGEERSRLEASVPVKTVRGFSINPDFKSKPLPPITKRAVLRVDTRATGLTYFEMG
eukprot:TRINITY_DN78546_c0_g1_i1.p1 TRINITY_DN78546_c0_g1~~TRINITY_DN78546_c0_g1_i1.p1  ORF type:complete len:203 (-),score=50.09 TRINITY_DN78546_c0_g1_i1:58-645(-)